MDKLLAAVVATSAVAIIAFGVVGVMNMNRTDPPNMKLVCHLYEVDFPTPGRRVCVCRLGQNYLAVDDSVCGSK